jgi:hypothetical protein
MGQPQFLGSACVSRAGLKAWPSLGVRCSGVPPRRPLFCFIALREAEHDIERGRLVANEQMKVGIGEWNGNNLEGTPFVASAARKFLSARMAAGIVARNEPP